jgi:CDP-diacylglycerol--serine O-phosphatidyltransferase
MSEFDQHEFGFQGLRPRNHRLRRGIYLLPSILTVLNLLCGYYAVLAALHGGAENFDLAACAIGFAFLFDSLDGRIARITGSSTEFGKQFDSLADVISFGIAPAVLMYAWGVRGVISEDAVFAGQITKLGWLLGLIFVTCCAWRLARFNVHGMAPGSSRYFMGLPTPAAAGVIAAVVHAFAWRVPQIEDLRWSLAWMALAGVLAALMTSTVRYYSFKDIAWTKRQPSLAIVLVVLIGGGVFFYSKVALLVLSAAYAAVGIVFHIVRVVRHRLVSRTA